MFRNISEIKRVMQRPENILSAIPTGFWALAEKIKQV